MAALGVILMCLTLSVLVFAERRSLLVASKRCVATATQRGACHLCVCTTSGVYHCRDVGCSDDTLMSNVTKSTRRHSSLPKIRDGDMCTPGLMYRNDCNTCKCTDEGGLMCTKMACIDWKSYAKKTHGKKILRTQEPQPKVSYLPKLPKGPCKPGKIYRSGCRRCFCTDKNKIMCSKKKNEACVFDKEGHPYPIRTPEDVRPTFTATLRDDVETLPSASEKCIPGKTYRVDCNNCICLTSGDLVCQQKLCISYEDMNRLETNELSGLPCTPGEESGTKCVKCKCLGGVTQCTTLSGCQPSIVVKLAGTGQKLKEEITVPSENCVPETIYKVNCNRCYCQPDGSLRCTQKSCLNFSQIKLLQKQREHLEKHGL